MRLFWAPRRGKTAGPCESREAALDAFREAFPFTGPDCEARAKRHAIMTGYGAHGPQFDVQWHDAREVSR